MLWCLHCNRTFPGRDARPEPYFGRQGCGYDDCTAAGFDIDIFNAEGARAMADPADPADPADVREAILGIDCGDDVDGVTHFQRLGLQGLAALLSCRFIEPDARQNRAPSTLECLTFLGRWPEVRVHGYAVHRDREGDGGRVSIEGFECDLEGVAEGLRSPLREAFRRFEHADEFVDDGEHLYAWWD
ncbi:MAG: hypothetical protein Q8S73_23610 [Deltaproteobacteria bacterium]|nr:hypothetical protein [Myxococcales bacterium]MDP3217118.1 hypothetical protein [Deltaproteobacteria bacterium]